MYLLVSIIPALNKDTANTTSSGLLAEPGSGESTNISASTKLSFVVLVLISGFITSVSLLIFCCNTEINKGLSKGVSFIGTETRPHDFLCNIITYSRPPVTTFLAGITASQFPPT